MVNHTIEGQYNGVSQQPYNLRQPTQCEYQENVINSLVYGVYKRHPMKLINNLFSTNNNVFYHVINRDKDEKYFIRIDDTSFKIIDELGTNYNIKYENNDVINYLDTTNKLENIRATTIADTTLFLNRTIKIEQQEKETVQNEVEINYTPYKYYSSSIELAQEQYSSFNFELGFIGYFHLELEGNIFKSGFIDTTTNEFIFEKLSIPNLVKKALLVLINNIILSNKFIAEMNGSDSIIFYKKNGEKIYNIKFYQYNTYGEPNVNGVIINKTDIIYSTIGGETINDYTIDNIPYKSFVYIKNGIASQDYQVILNNIIYSYSTSDSSQFETYKTNVIAQNLNDQINLNTEFSCVREGNILKIKRIDNKDFDFKVFDTWGNQAISGFKTKVSNENELPPTFFNNEIIQVLGPNGSETSGNTYRLYKDGVWKEWKKYGIIHKLNNNTLPIRLQRLQKEEYIKPGNPNGIYFYLSNIDYDERMVGDENSAPFPSFLNNTINNLFLFENRLCFLSSNNIIFSRSGDFYNFFPSTATETLDDDPIDISIASTNVSNIKDAIPFNSNLILFTDKNQYMISSTQGTLTPKSISIDPTTNFEANDLMRPITVGSNIYFSSNKGNYSNIREYFVQSDSITNDAADITSHIPRYIPKNIIKMTASSNINMLFVLSKEETKTIYVYNYYWAGNTKAQSAWNKWTFKDNIENIEVIDNELYIFSNKNNEIIFTKINLEKEEYEELGWDINLDNRFYIMNRYYDELNNETIYNIPYKITELEIQNEEFIAVNRINGFQVNIKTLFKNITYPNETIYTDTPPTSTYLKLNGDLTNYNLVFGYNYLFKHTLSQLSIKSEGTNVSEVEGRLQIKSLSIAYFDSLFFDVIVKPLGRNEIIKTYTGTNIGLSILGQLDVNSGVFKSYIMTNSKNDGISITNNTYLPSGFQTLSWEGMFNKRTRTI